MLLSLMEMVPKGVRPWVLAVFHRMCQKRVRPRAMAQSYEKSARLQRKLSTKAGGGATGGCKQRRPAMPPAVMYGKCRKPLRSVAGYFLAVAAFFFSATLESSYITGVPMNMEA